MSEPFGNKDSKIIIYTGCSDKYEDRIILAVTKGSGVYFDHDHATRNLDVVLRFDKDESVKPDRSYVWEENYRNASIHIEKMRSFLLEYAVLGIKGYQ